MASSTAPDYSAAANWNLTRKLSRNGLRGSWPIGTGKSATRKLYDCYRNIVVTLITASMSEVAWLHQSLLPVGRKRQRSLPISRLLANLPGRRTRRSAVGQDYLRHGDLSTPICANLAARQLPSTRQLSRYRSSERGDLVTHGIILPASLCH